MLLLKNDVKWIVLLEFYCKISSLRGNETNDIQSPCLD